MTVQTTKMLTKLTGQSVVAASLRLTSAGLLAGGVSLSGVRGGLDLGGTSAETGLSLGWATVEVGSVRVVPVMRDERPTRASKAVEAAAKHGAYLQAVGAGATQKQNEQLINQAKAAFIGAGAIRIRAFRGPEPWRERT